MNAFDNLVKDSPRVWVYLQFPLEDMDQNPIILVADTENALKVLVSATVGAEALNLRGSTYNGVFQVSMFQEQPLMLAITKTIISKEVQRHEEIEQLKKMAGEA